MCWPAAAAATSWAARAGATPCAAAPARTRCSARTAGTFTGNGNVLNNMITGGVGNDILRGYGGDDTLNGGGGSDEVQLRGVAADYVITAEGDGWRIADSIAGRDGSTLVLSVETLRFSDNTTQTLAYSSPGALLDAKHGDGGPLVSPLAAVEALFADEGSSWPVEAPHGFAIEPFMGRMHDVWE